VKIWISNTLEEPRECSENQTFWHSKLNSTYSHRKRKSSKITVSSLNILHQVQPLCFKSTQNLIHRFIRLCAFRIEKFLTMRPNFRQAGNIALPPPVYLGPGAVGRGKKHLVMYLFAEVGPWFPQQSIVTLQCRLIPFPQNAFPFPAR